eukprot:TRINITY_DN702_c0_g1_i1.p1 TRINITY_DN702_c0_g1~~TRINITY_DN702_c0_g1_i1.p1  ORF type:complete len:263 (+),score=77.31 TRINITY_DN702_c0_g1_i1:109-897(+)
MAAIAGAILTPTATKNCLVRTPEEFASFSGLRVSSPRLVPATSLSVDVAAPKQHFVVRAATTVAPTYTALKPLGDRILVKIDSAEETTAAGIVLPVSAQTKPQGGEVVEVGDGRVVRDKKIPVSIAKGSNIVYSKYAGTEIDFAGAPHLLLKEDDVVGMLSGENIKDLKPMNDRVLIKVAEVEEKTLGGVLLTESAKEKPVVGAVVAVGPGALGEDGERKPVELRAGDTVLYSKYAGNDFKNKDGSQYVVLRASDVMAVLSS